MYMSEGGVVVYVHLVSSVKVFPHDGCLVFQHCELKGITDHAQLLVT